MNYKDKWYEKAHHKLAGSELIDSPQTMPQKVQGNGDKHGDAPEDKPEDCETSRRSSTASGTQTCAKCGWHGDFHRKKDIWFKEYSGKIDRPCKKFVPKEKLK